MPKILLAIDDSATMRKVLEITFSGEDFQVFTAAERESALTHLASGPYRNASGPRVAVVDTSIEGDDGYGLAKEVRKRDPNVTLILLASRFHPYDAARGQDAGADDYIDKPFDTQVLLDKVRKAIGLRETIQQAGPSAIATPAPSPVAAQPPVPPTPPAATPAHAIAPLPPAASAAPRPPAPPAAPIAQSTISHQPMLPGAPPAAALNAPVVPPVGQNPPAATARTHTLLFDSKIPLPPAEPGRGVTLPGPAPMRTLSTQTPSLTKPIGSALPAHVPAPPPTKPLSDDRPNSAIATSASAPVSVEMTNRLRELGLNASQIDGVLALSREVVERVVWEVVPQLAETMIKEEIARLTKEP